MATWSVTTADHHTGGTTDTIDTAWTTALDSARHLVELGTTETITATVEGSPTIITPALHDDGSPRPEETLKAITLLRELR